MITAFFVQIFAALLWIPVVILSMVEWAMPDVIITTLNELFGFIRYADGIFPLTKRPEMTGIISQIGMADLLVFGYQYLFWYLAVRLLLKIISPARFKQHHEEIS